MYTKCIKSMIFITVCFGVNLVNSHPDIAFRIVGGNIADEGQFPFLVSIQKPENGYHICGGTLIAKEWVLTAAACVEKETKSELVIVAGTNKLDSKTSTRVQVANIILHSSYNPNNNANNVALLRLREKVNESKFIQIVEMEKNYINESQHCVGVGWGLTSYPSSHFPSNLIFLNTKSISVQECRDRLPDYPISDSNLCTMTQAGEGFCSGDTGGPLVVEEEGTFEQIAILSWGIPCARGYPDVNSRISYFYEFIKSVMQN